MIEHPATWKSVDVGHYIQDKADNAWRVADIELRTATTPATFVHLIGAAGKPGLIRRPPEHFAVTILILNTQEILEHELGAKEVTS